VNRIHEHLNPGPLTRLMSVARQLDKLRGRKFRIKKNCPNGLVAGKLVRVAGISLDNRDEDDPVIFHVITDDSAVGFVNTEDFDAGTVEDEG